MDDSNSPGGRDSGVRTPTHRALLPSEMTRLGELVVQAASGRPVDHATIEALARAHDVGASALYAAAGSNAAVEFTREHKVAFVVCGGACQGFGALEILEHLVELRQKRHKSWFKKAFDIQAKSCLNGCEHAPMVRVHTRDGIGWLRRTTPGEVAEAVKDLCG